MSSIQAIDTVSIHRICSSQVVVDLATAVKELVENSLDAGATIIEVKLVEHGADSIEVHDNACGIDPENYAGLVLKHHTSKMEQFEDLSNLSSFGFRGEALNSLCELSESFLVTTKRPVDPVGKQLSFDRFGRLTKEEVVARGNGTSILISKLFSSLPVRRSEFVRSIKKQFQKMLRIVQAYGIFSTGIKLIVTNMVNGTKQTVLSTQQSNKLEDNLCSLFGSKFISSLQPFSVNINSSPPSSVKGFVSKIGLGVGRNDNDRQFIFLNGRPVDMPRLVKALNETWRKYEMKQKPAFVLDITVDRATVDVNLAPNKREVLIESEDVLVDMLKETVDNLYSQSRNTFAVNNPADVRTLTSFSQFSMLLRTPDSVATPPVSSSQNPRPTNHLNTPITSESNMSVDASKEESARNSIVWASPAETLRYGSLSVPPSATQAEWQPCTDPVNKLWTGSVPSSTAPLSLLSTQEVRKRRREEKSVTLSPGLRGKRRRKELLGMEASMPSSSGGEIVTPKETLFDDSAVRVIEKNDFARMRVLGQFNLGFIIAELDGDLYILDQHACDEKFRFEGLQRNTRIHQQPLLKPLVVETTAALENTIGEHLEVFRANGFTLKVDEDAPAGRRVLAMSLPFSKGTQFGIEDVNELASMLSEEYGEEYFEGRASKNYLLLKNDPVVRSSRIMLPKIMSMFASRACRTAVMIGTALTTQEMRHIVGQMVDVEQPWNCPHGRPTMRHLVDYDDLKAELQKSSLPHNALEEPTVRRNTEQWLDTMLEEA